MRVVSVSLSKSMVIVEVERIRNAGGYIEYGRVNGA